MQSLFSGSNTLLIELPLWLQLIGLTFAVLIDPYIRKKHRSVMLVIIAIASSLIVQNFADFALSDGTGRVFARTLACIYGAGTLAAFIRERLMMRISQGSLKKLRDTMFEKMERQSSVANSDAVNLAKSLQLELASP